MARCFCCDKEVPHECYDSKTDRHYCSVCIEPTIEVQLAAIAAENAKVSSAYNQRFLDMVELVEEGVDYGDVSLETLREDDDECPWDE